METGEAFDTNISKNAFIPETPITNLNQFLYNAKNSFLSENDLRDFLDFLDLNRLTQGLNEHKTSFSLDKRMILHNNTIKWCQHNISLVSTNENGHTFIIYSCKDIDDWKEYSHLCHLAIDSYFDLISEIDFTNDETHAVISANSEYLEMENTRYFGTFSQLFYSMKKYIVDEDKEYFDKTLTLANIRNAFKSVSKMEFNIHILYCGQRLTKRFRLASFNEQFGTVYLSIKDISKSVIQKEAKQEELTYALNEARRASDATTQFLSRMSHDMRTPMNGILGITELSLNETDPIVIRENLVKIKKSGVYLLGLINDTLDYQRIQSGRLILEPTPLNCNALIHDIVDIISENAKIKNVSFSYEMNNVDPELSINADEMRLKQIFINLLSNAIKFTPSQGKVTFSFSLLSQKENTVNLRFCVSDNGIGMSDQFLKERIYQPFSQEYSNVASQYAESGLGLSIVKSLVELMKGTITVDSILGKGTVFTILLTMDKSVNRIGLENAKDNASSEKNLPSTLKAKVLLVEDNSLNAEIAKRLLEKRGCIVTWANNGLEGLNKFKDSPEANGFDCILMDIRMPIMDGYQATEEIRKLKRDDAKLIPIIALSANAYNEDIKKSLSVGMNAHLSKPFDPINLSHVINEQVVKFHFLMAGNHNITEKPTLLIVDDSEMDLEIIKNNYPKIIIS